MQFTCSEVFPTDLAWEIDTDQFVHDHLAKKMFYSFLMIVMFLVPVLMMAICYTLIVLKLYCTTSPGERIGRNHPKSATKKNVLKLLMVVMVMFVICWSPLQLFMATAVFYTEYQVKFGEY